MPGVDSRVSNLMQAMRRAEAGDDPDSTDDEDPAPHDEYVAPDADGQLQELIKPRGLMTSFERLFNQLFGGLSTS
jgi:hypothetical protein